MNNSEEVFSRTRCLLGNEAMRRLEKARVAVFGIGGVGGYAAEALCRGGVGAIDICDADTVAPSNINRQLIALNSTVGMYKTDAAAARMADINPACRVIKHTCFYGEETEKQFDFSAYDFIIDAIDTVTSKLLIIKNAQQTGTNLICSMGTGNKLYPEMLKIDKLEKTSVCPLARTMRYECRKRGFKNVTVLYSTEQAITPEPLPDGDENSRCTRRAVPASCSFVPGTAGLMLAGYVIRNIAGV